MTSRRTVLPCSPAVIGSSRPPVRSRFLSEAECAALLQQVHQMAVGEGTTGLGLESRWMGNLRWARNRVTTSGDIESNDVRIDRTIRGASGHVQIDSLEPPVLEAAVRRAEWMVARQHVEDERELWQGSISAGQTAYPHPLIWSEASANLDGNDRAAAARGVIAVVEAAGMFAAGYLEVTAQGRSVATSQGQLWYYPYTRAQYSITVRDPRGTASGWAGIDWSDWTKIDAAQLTARALHKCLTSRNPVAIEPGRYTVILEPQAVADLIGTLFDSTSVRAPIPPMIREVNENPLFKSAVPFFKDTGVSKIGERLLDERITISADPMDPELGVPPFDVSGQVYRPVQWFEHGVLTQLEYDRKYARQILNQDAELPNSGAFRMSGGTTTIDEMIATTPRGLLVTRFSDMMLLHPPSWLLSGYTRDGLWLIEKGVVSKPVKNFRFTESPFFAFNQMEQLGVPQRVFHPSAPWVVPPIKVRDFSFTSLSEAV